MMDELIDFLPCRTPEAWCDLALGELPMLLLDHAHCERKAAMSAMSLIHNYQGNHDLLMKMSQLVREEMLHFEKVVQFLEERGLTLKPLAAARYAKTLREGIRTFEPARLVDQLIVGALIEARSCERFASLVPRLVEEEPALSRFYQSLLRSEARHFQDYLELAEAASKEDIAPRIAFFKAIEEDLITSADPNFRFHSGVPA